MSSFSERDEAVIELIEDGDGDELDDSDYERTIENLVDRVGELEQSQTKLQANVQSITNRVFCRLDDLEERVDGEQSEDVPPIVRKTRMSPQERKENLSKSEYLAVLLHEYWDEIRWEMGVSGTDIKGVKNDNKTGVDTRTKANAKNNPSKLKYRLKQYANEDLHSNQVYRALQKLAKDSGGAEYTKNGRVEIRGGIYEYREVPTADASHTRRVVWRATE